MRAHHLMDGDDYVLILAGLRAVARDARRSVANAERRDKPQDVADKARARRRRAEDLVERLEAEAAERRRVAERAREKRRKHRRQTEGKDRVALAVWELKRHAEVVRALVAADGYAMEEDVLADMRRVRQVAGGALFDHGVATGAIDPMVPPPGERA